MGKPFWLHKPCDEVLFCDLTAEAIENPPEPLCAAVPIRHQRWNLFGVCGDDPMRLADGVAAWRWQTDGYERCGENAILQPGEAVWIFVISPLNVVVKETVPGNLSPALRNMLAMEFSAKSLSAKP